MSKFRSKPVTIEAVQWHKHGDHIAVTRNPHEEHYSVMGVQGWVRVDPGDWIIEEPMAPRKGEFFYPCKPDVFELKYEPVP